MQSTSLQELMVECPKRIQKLFNTYAVKIPSIELREAMQHTVMTGGKYLRPLLIYATGTIFNTPFENLDLPATAVELIHAYSLIHDDLPCMDNALLRRGQPCCHKVYGEGMAVLAGDALHTLAIQIITSHPAQLSEKKRLQMITSLSVACGPFGMAAGQALDISLLCDKDLPKDLLPKIYELKTGALLTACLELGWIASNDDDSINRKALLQLGAKMGLAFQIQDDILDIESHEHLLGKAQGIDSLNKKNTYPLLFGLEQAKEKVNELYEESLSFIDYLGSRADYLREIITLMLNRKN